MSITTLKQPAPDVPENRIMDSSPRSDQPRRRTISPAQKLAYLEGYEQAIQTSEGGSYLRANGIYSSHIAEWRKLRNAGILDEHATTGQCGTPPQASAERHELRRANSPKNKQKSHD